MTDIRERVARAIYEDRYHPETNPQWLPWDDLKAVAKSEDGGNGIYLTMFSHADAALSAMPPTWLPLPAEPVPGVAPWDGRPVFLCEPALAFPYEEEMLHPDAVWCDQWGQKDEGGTMGWLHAGPNRPTHWRPGFKSPLPYVAPLPAPPEDAA